MLVGILRKNMNFLFNRDKNKLFQAESHYNINLTGSSNGLK